MKIIKSVRLTDILLLFIFVNLIILDYYLIVSSSKTDTSVLGVSTQDVCPQSCVDKFKSYSVNSSIAKEYFVPLGAGINSTDDWADVPGAQVSINTSQYNKINTVTFEATLQIPNGNQKIWARLFNSTDKHPVWYSEVTTESAGPILLNSSPITLDQGNKTYQVQMKTQLKSPANLLQSRIHIVTY